MLSMERILKLRAPTKTEIVLSIDEKRRKQNKLNTHASLPKLDPRTINKIMSEIAPESSADPSIKSPRLIEAVGDPFNYISQCCLNIMTFRPDMLGLDPSISPIPEDVHNIDEASFLLNLNVKIKVFGPKGSITKRLTL